MQGLPTAVRGQIEFFIDLPFQSLVERTRRGLHSYKSGKAAISKPANLEAPPRDLADIMQRRQCLEAQYEAQRQSRLFSFQGKCYNCGITGHKAVHCKKLRKPWGNGQGLQ